jgi:hypothetical protein
MGGYRSVQRKSEISTVKLFDLPAVFLLSLKRRQESSLGMLDRATLAGSVKINEGGPP